MTELIKKLMRVPGVSGRERNTAEIIKAEITPYCDEVYTDNLGNLYAHKRGSGKKLAFAAHMDEIGFFVSYIEDSGLVRVTPVGGFNYIAAAYSGVTFENGVRGVIIPGDEDTSKSEKYFVDIGTASRKQTEKKLSLGEFGTLDGGITRLSGKRYAGRPFDDRIGCAVLIEAAKQIKKSENDLYFVFTVQEEVGCRGAFPAAFNLEADYAIAVDVTATGDVPGAKTMAVKLGGGAAVKIRDNSVICDRHVVEKLKALAEENNIKHQLEILERGGTDTGAMQRSGHGARVGAVSVPTRYIHTAVECVDMGDVNACVKLISLAAQTRFD